MIKTNQIYKMVKDAHFLQTLLPCYIIFCTSCTEHILIMFLFIIIYQQMCVNLLIIIIQ